MQMRVHSFVPFTLANGPGRRCCLWLQGCTLACDGCFNPESHSKDEGKLYQVAEVFEWIKACKDIEGITVSGGEPLQQPEPLITLLERIKKETNLSVVLFSGFSTEELNRSGLLARLNPLVDVLVAGRYAKEQNLQHGLIGSSNKDIHFLSDRYTKEDLDSVPVGEVIISQDGELVLSGIDPLSMR